MSKTHLARRYQLWPSLSPNYCMYCVIRRKATIVGDIRADTQTHWTVGQLIPTFYMDFTCPITHAGKRASTDGKEIGRGAAVGFQGR